MKNIFKNYKQTILLIISMIIGTIIGLIFKDKATILQPLGDVFINLLYVIIIPLIFLTITTTISKMNNPKRLGKVMFTIIVTFVITSLVAVFVGLLTTYNINLVNVKDSAKIIADFDNGIESSTKLNVLEKTVAVLTVNDFRELLTKGNLIALLVFSILTGISINMAKEKAEPFKKLLESANAVVMKFINIIMYYAPIGICCYFASLIGNYGSSIAVGYLKTFIIYLIISVLYYIIIYSIYALIAGGKEGLRRYWKSIIPVTLTSISTCSSAACIPVNIENAKSIGVPDDIAETTVPLGTSFHKDGSIIGSVFKIMFLVCLFGTDVSSTGSMLKILLIALIANLLVSAVPIGGGTISEMLIISMLGYPVAALPILTIIATIIDAPATMLNVVGDTASSMLVTRMVDGKDWLKKNKKEKLD